MPDKFSEPAEKIIENYLERLKRRLKGFPEHDQEELVKEIHSHIYESYINDPTENEIERVFNVLDKLGEPEEVVSSRMPGAMVKMGKKKKLPLYIVAGVLIAFFGLPLGLGGVSMLIAIVITVLALIASFYIIAFSLIISGWVGAFISIARIIDPYFLDTYVHLAPVVSDPTLNNLVNLIFSLAIAGLGVALFWLGRYMMRGIRFLFNMTFERIKSLREKRRLQPAD